MNEKRDPQQYTDYLHGQVRELLTGFGDVDILWLDFSFPRLGPEGKGREDWRSEELVETVRELMPNVILNDRLDLPESADVRTPEQFQPREWVTVDGERCVWETCQTFSGSWGYHRDEASWKSVDQLIRMLVDTVSKGGNLLLNVGPTGRGEFDERALDRLAGMGEWMRRHGRSVYGCSAAPGWAKTPEDCRLTYNDAARRMYVHIFAWPFKHLHLDGFAGKIEYAQLLHDASEVRAAGIEDWQAVYLEEGSNGTVTLELPVQKPEVTVPVIELFLR